MSRLFDALKVSHAARKGGEEVWEALEIDGTEISAAAVDFEVREQVSEPVSGLDEAMETPAAEEDVLKPTSRQGQESFGTTTKVVLDQSAPLLQYAVNPVVVDHYRTLRTKIQRQQVENPFRSLVVTSAGPQEGKTLTVLNLGWSFAVLPSKKVLIIDADMRTGTLGRSLGVDDQRPGLSNLIDGSAQLEDVVLKSDEVPMHFIVCGNSKVPDLQSSQLTSHFRKLTEQFDIVLVDTPPVNLIADAQLLAASCDAVLLVARAFSTTRRAFEKAVQDLSPFRVIGTVLNGGVPQSYRYRYGKD